MAELNDPQIEPTAIPHDQPIARDYFSLHAHGVVSEPEPEYEEDDDIYRGELPSPPRSPPPESISTTTSSSSSSSSSVFGGRLGAISTLVEHAIARWARGRDSSDSLSTSSSTTSTSSIVTAPRSYRSRRRKRRSSSADEHNARSEREIAARIRAREALRQVSREFVLYTPTPTTPSEKPRSRPRGVRDENSGVLRTTSLPLIVSELSVALKTHMKTRRAQDMARAGAAHMHPASPLTTDHGGVLSLPHQDYMLPEHHAHKSHGLALDDTRIHKRGKKGKQRAGNDVSPSVTPPTLSRTTSVRELDKAWWLDVSSPTWEDMRAIGKLLHLHPLTLEDILQQDPREKLELFPKLGYYFVVFRAIESQKTRDKRRLMSTIATDAAPTMTDEGIVGEVNVYLVVFREGICSFHFSDISEHTDAVRSKVLMYAQSGTVTMSSDWIAHGIMDSIVDSFFPFLDEIEKEVLSIEDLVFNDEETVDSQNIHISKSESRSSSSDTAIFQESSGSGSASSNDNEKPGSESLIEKASPTTEYTLHTQYPPRTHFALPSHPVFSWRRFKHGLRNMRNALTRMDVRVKRPQDAHVASSTIGRVSRMRRLVTSLARVLATKSEVVASVKKRLLMSGESGLGNGSVDDQDVFVYMGDVQDHIITLQQSLAHYERMLSQSHPTYLMHVRLFASRSKSGSDKAIVILTMVSMAVLVVQGVIGFNSMNIHVPQNYRKGTKYIAFGVVVAICIVLLCMYAALVRWWWVRARLKRRRL